ncbi:MAG: hypothetical protein GF364_11630, partial [Candidatus Lokiarchaeota archaeon]|nr:hypothetical protein [Candidatus Lokiarchaeota archaeon]
MSNRFEANFKEQFKAIGYSLARKADKDVKNIEQNSKNLINKMNIQFVEEIKRELRQSTLEFVKDYEYNLNQQISENVSETSRMLLSKKNELYQILK